jgi:hypothetical protein
MATSTKSVSRSSSAKELAALESWRSATERQQALWKKILDDVNTDSETVEYIRAVQDEAVSSAADAYLSLNCFARHALKLWLDRRSEDLLRELDRNHPDFIVHSLALAMMDHLEQAA